MKTMIAVLLMNLMTALAGAGEAYVPYDGTQLTVDEMAIMYQEKLNHMVDGIEELAEENTLEIVDFDNEVTMEKTGDDTYRYHINFSAEKEFDLNVRFIRTREDTYKISLKGSDGQWEVADEGYIVRGQYISTH